MDKFNEKGIVLESIDVRKNDLEEWLKSSCGLSDYTLHSMVGDASFRRYFRVMTPRGTYVAMDAPPPQERCAPFVAIAHALRAQGLQAPEIYQTDIERGYLLLSDFGDATYLKSLKPSNVDELYQRALDALAQLQACAQVNGHEVPPFTRDFMRQEWCWHKEWFLGRWLNIDAKSFEPELDACFDILVESAASQPQVFMHRDFHSGNLMVLPDSVGILDFQDAFVGPITYDLASLLRDCYIDWPDAQVKQWALGYRDRVQQIKSVDDATFMRWFDLMGMERHLKALFTFARKHVRDQQSQYLQHVPRTLNYLISVSKQYPELAPLHEFLSQQVLSAVQQKELLCAQ